MSRNLLSSMIFAIVAFQSASVVMAQCEIEKFYAIPRESYGYFGESVAMDGNWAVVSHSGDREAIGSGAVYLFKKHGTQWSFFTRLTVPDSEPIQRFAEELDMQGDLIVAADLKNPGGAVYVFERIDDFWLYQSTIDAPTLLNHGFGASVAVTQDAIVVGSPSENTFGTQAGTAYVYRRNENAWELSARLDGSDVDASDESGRAVDIHGDFAVVGAPGTGSTGAAYVFRWNGSFWIEEAKLEAAAGLGKRFGTDVSIRGNRIIVGSPETDGNANDAGSAFVFERIGGSWSQIARLRASMETGNLKMGGAVAIDGDRAVVGAREKRRAYLFHNNGFQWSETAELQVYSDSSVYYGESVAIFDDEFIVGDSNHTIGADFAGAAYFYKAGPDCDCLDGSVNLGAGGVAQVLGINGIFGGPDRTVYVQSGDPVYAFLLTPPAGGNGKFAIHANVGRPTPESVHLLPEAVGLTCFPFLLTDDATPVAIWNNLGHPDFLGESNLRGIPIADPDPASSVFLDVPSALAPFGTMATLQGVIIDPGSESVRGASVTNAIILRFE